MELQNSITGIVTGPEGPLEGVTVTVKGTSVSTVTDMDGQYSIEAEEGNTLIFSSIGFRSQEVPINDSTVNVELKGDDTSLDEVVVVGYGQQKKANLTGAVSSINTKENLESRPIDDVGRSIQGASPGLSVTIPSGEIGSDPSIKIRGALGSFESGSEPLVLVDNVEVPSIQYVNPNDVEDITVLKDAARSEEHTSELQSRFDL